MNNLGQALKELVSSVAYLNTHHENDEKERDTKSPLSAVKSVCTIIKELSDEDLPYASTLLFSTKKEAYKSHTYAHSSGVTRQVHTEGLLGFLDQSMNFGKMTSGSKAWVGEFLKAREEAVILMQEVVKHIGKDLEEYCECVCDIRDTLFESLKYDSNGTSAFNVACIKGLNTLYKLQFSALINSDEDKIDEIADFMLTKFNSSKSSQTVKGWALKFLSLLCYTFSNTVMKNRCEYILQTVLSSLDSQFRSQKPDMQIIDGALSGICSLSRINRGDLMKSDSNSDKRVQLLYKYMCISLEPIKEMQRYDIPRAGLRILRTHAGHLLSRYLTEDAERMFRRLFPICTHVNNKLRHKALIGLDSFLEAVCKELLSGARSPESDKKTFLFLINELFNLLESPNSSSRDIAMGIRGLGRLSAAMRLFFNDDYIRTRLDGLYLFAERLLPGGSQAEEDALLHAARFVGSYAAIAAQLSSIDEARISQMERLVYTLFQTYPDLHASQKPGHHLALLQIFCAVSGKGNGLRSLLSRFMVQGLLMTCSEPGARTPSGVIGELGQEKFLSDQIPLYVEYIPLWKSLLEPSDYDKRVAGTLLSGEGKTAEKREEEMNILCNTIYDVFIQGVLHTIQKLDLTYTIRKDISDSKGLLQKSTTEEEKEDDSLADEVVAAPGMYIPRSPKEMETFLNLVEFMKLLLPSTSVDKFKRWPLIFGREIISISTKLPLISGFYRLLTISMKICEKSSYFAGITKLPENTSASRTESFILMECEDGENEHMNEFEQKRLCKELYAKFLHEVAMRLQQYQDELLCACLELILEAPCQLLTPFQIVKPLVQAFDLGTSHLPIALTALHSLRRWLCYEEDSIDGHDDIKSFLPKILPSLDAYLLIPAKAATEDTGGQQQPIPQNQWSKGKYRQNKYLQLARSTNVTLEEVQEEIVLLLGSLGNLCGSIIGKVDLSDEKRLRGPAIAWDMEKKIELKLEFGRDRLEMLLDSLFPRVLILAESSSNRQTKIAACELLHSLLLLIIGLESRDTNMTKYYEKALPVVLRLATDTEFVARQLFEPLIVQIIHWFTSPTETRRQKHSENAEYLLEILTENVCAKGQSALRDLCARCIGEYVAWGIKHTPPDQSRSPKSLAGVQIRLLLDRTFTLSRLYDPAKRLGAAITLQKIIVPLREDEGLASLFTLEIAHHALFSLRLAHSSGIEGNNIHNSTVANEDEKGELLAAEMQMSHVVRSLCRVIKHYAQCFINASASRHVHQSLEEFLSWVLESALTRHETIHQKLCFEVLDALVTFLPPSRGKVENWELFISAVTNDSFENELKLFEDAPNCKLTAPQLDILTSTLDSFAWASSHGLQPSIPKKGHLSARIEGLISSVLEREKVGEELTSSRREAIRALFDYITSYTKKGVQINNLIDAVPDFLNMFLRCVLLPSAVSCKTLSITKNRTFRNSLIDYGKLLQEAMKKDTHLYTIVQTTMKQILDEPTFNIMSTDFTFSTDSFRSELTQELCIGYSDLYYLGFFSSSEGSDIGESILLNLLDTCDKHTTPAKSVLANALFELALNLIGDSVSLVQILTKEDSNNLQTFYSAFEGRIIIHILNERNFDHFCSPIMDGMEKSEILWSLFTGLLSRRNNVQSDKNIIRAEDIVSIVLRHTETLEKWSYETSPVELKERTLEALELLARMHQQTFSRLCEGAILKILSTLLGASSKALKIRALGLLRYLGLEGISKLRDKVHDIVTYDFPMRSSDLRSGSTACNEYLAMLDELLKALETTGSPVLLEELYPVIREKDHMHKKAILEAFCHIEECVPGEQQLELVEVALSGSTERGYPQDLKNALISNVVIPLLEHLPQEHLVKLMCKRITSIVKTVSLGVEHGHPIPQEKQHALFDRINAFALLRAAYERLTPEVIRADLNNAYIASNKSTGQPPKGNELTQAAMRAAHAARSERVIVDGEWVTDELVLKYHCFAYAALAAVVICTQSKEAFYTTLFFKEHPEKNDFIWTNVINLNNTFKFDVETNFPIATKAFRSLQTDSPDATGEIARKRRRVDGIKYISTQYLQDSTFSQDLSYIGSFVSSTTNSTNTSPTSTMIGGEDADVGEKAKTDQRKESTTEMEMDEVNKSLLMVPFMRLLDSIASKFPLKTDGEVPDWEDELLTKFKDEEIHMNIRIFIAKCLLNRPQIFTVHSQYWIRPILKFAVTLPQTQGISYFLRDICVLILRWLKDKEDRNIQIDVLSSEHSSNLVSQFIVNYYFHYYYFIYCSVHAYYYRIT